MAPDGLRVRALSRGRPLPARVISRQLPGRRCAGRSDPRRMPGWLRAAWSAGTQVGGEVRRGRAHGSGDRKPSRHVAGEQRLLDLGRALPARPRPPSRPALRTTSNSAVTPLAPHPARHRVGRPGPRRRTAAGRAYRGKPRFPSQLARALRGDSARLRVLRPSPSIRPSTQRLPKLPISRWRRARNPLHRSGPHRHGPGRPAAPGVARQRSGEVHDHGAASRDAQPPTSSRRDRQAGAARR
jgi:hypothetical protein